MHDADVSLSYRIERKHDNLSDASSELCESSGKPGFIGSGYNLTMEILAAFAIILSLIAGFQPLKTQPKDEVSFTVETNPSIRIREGIESKEELSSRRIVKQNYDYSCGSAALATLLNFHLGEELTERQVINGLLQYGNSEKIAQRRAFSLLDMKRFVGALGYKGVGFKASIEDLRELEEPCILPIKIYDYRHFTVFKGYFDGHIFLSDPWRGNISFREDEFFEKWYNNVIFMINPGNVDLPTAMTLKEEDLQYIDEEMANFILFERGVPADLVNQADRPPQLPVDLHYKR